MSRERFLEIVKDPSLVDSSADLPIVSDIVKEYPFFAAAQVLLSKILYEQKSIYFDKQLKMAAAYSGDREVLYDLIHSKKADEPQPESAPASSPGEESVTEVPAPAEKESPARLELEYELPTAIDYFGAMNPQPKSAKETIDKESDLDSEPVAQPDITISESIDLENQNHSFTEWLSILSGKSSAPKVPKKINTGTAPVKKQPVDVDSIIDSFIKNEPRIKAKPGKFFSPEDMAHRSAEVDYSIATETLANIYISQGLNDKAIEIFKQLSLRYPQKKQYFAAKIEALENKDS